MMPISSRLEPDDAAVVAGGVVGAGVGLAVVAGVGGVGTTGVGFGVGFGVVIGVGTPGGGVGAPGGGVGAAAAVSAHKSVKLTVCTAAGNVPNNETVAVS